MTITVDDDGPADFSTILEAVNHADSGDTILVSPGLYTGSGNRDIALGSKKLILKSNSGPSSCIIDAQGSLAENHRIFHINSSENAAILIEGFTITNGYSDCGGGIYIDSTDCTIKNCILVNNTASSKGGGIYISNLANPRIENCTLAKNHCLAEPAPKGSAIFCEDNSQVVVENSIIWGNDNQDIYAPNAVVHFSCVSCGFPGVGNLNVPPCFVDFENNDFHLLSQGWRWDRNTSAWVQDTVTSPCIDTGNPGSLLKEEPLVILPDDPNNSQGLNLRINMGAYGGTAQASMPPVNKTLLTDITNNKIVDLDDFHPFASVWLQENLNSLGDFNRSGQSGPADLYVLCESSLKCILPMPLVAKTELADFYTPDTAHDEPTVPGYTLPLDKELVYGYSIFDDILHINDERFEQNGFVVLEDCGTFLTACIGGCPPADIREGFVTVYEQIRKWYCNVFITTDTLLHLYHVQFDETLKQIEENEFIPDITALSQSFYAISLEQYNQYSGQTKEVAKRNVAYFAVAAKLLNPDFVIPDFVENIVTGEITLIEAHVGFEDSPLFTYKEDYSQYKPRGHYTRSEALKRYFKAMMWYGRLGFIIKGGTPGEVALGIALVTHDDAKIQTIQASLITQLIYSAQVDTRTAREIWDRIYSVTAFYVGLADDLTPYDYINEIHALFGYDCKPQILSEEDNYLALKYSLSTLRSPMIYGGTGFIAVDPVFTPEQLNDAFDLTKGLRFMGQRFIPDSYIFQNLVYPAVQSYTGSARPFSYGMILGYGPGRAFPRGLDVMAVLGSDLASDILIKDGDTAYTMYQTKREELEAMFNAFTIKDWNKNLYWGWLYALKALLTEYETGHPTFMTTQAWQKKSLNAVLASWTELRHDTILYAKQSYTPQGKGGVPPPPDATGYVEPVPEFYRRLRALTEMTQSGLNNLDVLSPEANARLDNFTLILTRLIDISEKELNNLPLSSEDFAYIGNFSKTLESAITGVSSQGISTVMIADVHTDTNSQTVVEEGTGFIDLVVVACPLSNGSILLSVGPVFSYYEFKQPMAQRLTDAEWKLLLKSSNKPVRPAWYQQIMNN
ncbi:MAG TPA: DUF3160 domain-containing protein [Anaerohalosphaeraceae bacterium]|nr:DUF3160 domain-containing protein [Anaerohalosphaeraceae bacterium]